MRNGMIDKQTGTCPGMSEIMNTLPGTFSHENYDLMLNNFGELLQIQKAKGRIDDEDFEKMGLQKDKYFDGMNSNESLIMHHE